MGPNLILALFLLLPCLLAGLVFLFACGLRRRAAPARWPQILLGNGLALLFLLSLLLAAGEIYYRFIYDATDAITASMVSQRWKERYWHENAGGWHDNLDISPRIQGNKRRLTIVGDSFTAGQGIKDIEERFVNRLRRAHPEWEVHMIAEDGADTDWHLANLESIFTHGYQADTVLLIYVLNDISDLIPEWQDLVRTAKADYQNRNWLRRNSYFLDTLSFRFAARRNNYMPRYYELMRAAYTGPLWAQQQRRLTTLRDLVVAHGGRLEVVTFPFLNSLGANNEYAPIHAQLDQFWRGLGVPHLDLLPLYQNTPSPKLTVNRHDAHPNEYAHALAADAMEKFLRPQFSAP